MSHRNLVELLRCQAERWAPGPPCAGNGTASIAT